MDRCGVIAIGESDPRRYVVGDKRGDGYIGLDLAGCRQRALVKRRDEQVVVGSSRNVESTRDKRSPAVGPLLMA